MEIATVLPAPLPQRQAQSPAAKHLPGDLAIWIFIAAELLAFCVFFAAYAFTRAKNVALFDAEQLSLNRNAGALNTVLLLTASYFVVRGVQAAQAGLKDKVAPWLAGAFVCGGGFVAVKISEYADKLGAGINLSTSPFYMFYLSLTFFHFMHVILGMVILAALWFKARQGTYGPDNLNGLESGASYWHMVDLVWIILFPLVYVLR